MRYVRNGCDSDGSESGSGARNYSFDENGNRRMLGTERELHSHSMVAGGLVLMS